MHPESKNSNPYIAQLAKAGFVQPSGHFDLAAIEAQARAHRGAVARELVLRLLRRRRDEKAAEPFAAAMLGQGASRP